MTHKDKELVIARLEEYKGDSLGLIAATIEDCQRVVGEMPEEDGWISAEKPPEVWMDEDGYAINFLVVIPEVGVDIANWVGSMQRWVCLGIPCTVTHWMPLPEPPKGD